MKSDAQDAVLRRIDRIESTLAIHKLAYLYSKAIDTRDLDALAALFTEDAYFESVRAGTAAGREALRANWEHVLRAFGPTIHLVANHIVDFDTDDEARGVVYARAEHEVGDAWIVQTFQYWDQYVRQDEVWRFAIRRVMPWYAVDHLTSPAGSDKMRWPNAPHGEAPLPAIWPSWQAFEAANEFGG